ncbi:MAG: ABC transporter permease [Flavobacteriales bacterium]
MNFSLFIAKRLIGKKEYRFSKPIIRIAITAIALSLSVMLLSVTIINGFQKDIKDKVIGFSSHIQITSIVQGNSYESVAMEFSDTLHSVLNNIEGISHYHIYATKAGIIKTKDEIQGIMLKGISKDFNYSFMQSKLVDGFLPQFNLEKKSNEIIISKTICDKLKLAVNDKIQLYFVQNPVRVRSLTISGIFDTGVAELDEVIAFGDIRHIQKLNKWSSNQIGGVEILLDKDDNIEKINQEILYSLPYELNSRTVIENNPQLFDWLELQNLNVKVILFLMLIVAAINMITALFILILEQTQLIGTLKSLGATNWNIRKVFLYHSTYLILKGLFYGNIIGIFLAYVQKEFKIIALDPQTYYMSFIPIHLDLFSIFAINLGTILICVLILIIPTYLISKINPINTIRFE